MSMLKSGGIRSLHPFVLVLAMAIMALLVSFRPAHAVLEIDITQGNLEPLPIAIPAFTSATGDGDIAVQMSQVISNNLNRSGLFRTLDPASFIEQGLTVSAGPNFAEWRVINAQALVVGQVERQGDGRCGSIFACGTCSALSR
jgi:TolB protein